MGAPPLQATFVGSLRRVPFQALLLHPFEHARGDRTPDAQQVGPVTLAELVIERFAVQAQCGGGGQRFLLRSVDEPRRSCSRAGSRAASVMGFRPAAP